MVQALLATTAPPQPPPLRVAAVTARAFVSNALFYHPTPPSCMVARCTEDGSTGVTIVLADTERDARIGLGRNWDVGAIPEGTAPPNNSKATLFVLQS